MLYKMKKDPGLDFPESFFAMRIVSDHTDNRPQKHCYFRQNPSLTYINYR